MMSLETEHSEAIPKHLQALVPFASCRVELAIGWGWDPRCKSERMREVKLSLEKTSSVCRNPRPARHVAGIIFYDGIVSCPLYRFTYNLLYSPPIESPMLRPVLTLRILALRVTDIEHPPRLSQSEDFTPFSLPWHRHRLGRSTFSSSSLPRFPSVSISSSFSSLCPFFSFLFIVFNPASLVLSVIKVACERFTLVSPPLPRFSDPSAFYYQPYYPRDNPAAFTRSATLPRVSPSFFPRQDNILLRVYGET